MRRLYLQIGLTLLCAMLASSAVAQSTQPAGSFGELTRAFGAALADGSLDGLADRLEAEVSIASFDREALQSSEQLGTLLAGSRVLSVRAYARVPATLAGDLAADIRRASDLPDELRRAMTPDPDALPRANRIAASWIAQTLAPDKNQWVGVIALWPKASDDSANGPQRRLVFVLLKGRLTGGGAMIQQIVYGDPSVHRRAVAQGE